ncbi:hypothetical protein C0J52_01769 [Blattella germanica]|nr:hypothetical protein C0J52_01769 [Blattella germanica]
MSFSIPHQLRHRRSWKVILDNFNEEVVCRTVNDCCGITDKERLTLRKKSYQITIL